MKKGWINCRIGDICSITDFVSNGSFASLRENVKYYNSPNYAVLVRLADASNGFDKSKFVYTDEHGYDFSKKSHLHGGELIMSNVGSVGSMFICPVMTQPMTLAPNTISITSQNNKFLYYYFLSDGFKKKLKGITSSTTLKKFNKTNFKLLEIPIPSLPEQQSIVDYLDSAFAKIDAMKANAEKALGEAKALFQASLKEMLEPKEGWEEKTLKEVSVISGNYGLSVPSTEYNGIRYLRITDITEWGDLNDEKVSAKIDEGQEQELLEDGDILFARTGATVGKTLMYKDEFGDCLFAGYLIRYRLRKDIVNPKFMFYITHSNEYYKWILENQKAAAQPNISATLYNGYKVSYPSIQEQQSIVTSLDSLKSKVDRLQENYEKISQECDALKQAILRQVFE